MDVFCEKDYGWYIIHIASLMNRGIRFYLFDNNWIEFKKLINKVDRTYDEIC